MEQRTEEWLRARAGRVTSTGVADVLRVRKDGKPSDLRQTYLGRIVAERMTGQPIENGFQSAAMMWGVEQEPAAKGAYSALTGAHIDEEGLVEHPVLNYASCSPDGLVSQIDTFDADFTKITTTENGCIEVKCPNTATHIQTLLTEKVKPDYIHQMNWIMACTGSDWCDFISFDPRMPIEDQLFVKRFERDQEAIRDMETKVSMFLEEVDQTIAKIIERRNG
jgi:putative phage-type endonuclease